MRNMGAFIHWSSAGSLEKEEIQTLNWITIVSDQFVGVTLRRHLLTSLNLPPLCVMYRTHGNA